MDPRFRLPTHTSPKQAVLGEAFANQPPHGKAHHKKEFFLGKSQTELEEALKKVHEEIKKKESPQLGPTKKALESDLPEISLKKAQSEGH